MINFKKWLGRSDQPVTTELSAEAYALLQQLQQSNAGTHAIAAPQPLDNPFAPKITDHQNASPEMAAQAPVITPVETPLALDLPQARLAHPDAPTQSPDTGQTDRPAFFQMPTARTASTSEPLLSRMSTPDQVALSGTAPPHLELGGDIAMMPPVSETKDSKAKEKAKQKAKASHASREEKKQAAQRAREEKLRNQRRKALAKTRFSRARYLREINGNAITGIILWSVMIVASLIGPFLLNTGFLLPQTRMNIEVIGQIKQFEAVISQAQPQIAAANQRKAEKEAQINAVITMFTDTQAADEGIRNFIDDLKAAGMSVNESNLQHTQEDIAVSGLVGQTLIIDMKGDFLTYLRLRNRFVRNQDLVHVRDESIQAKPNNRIVDINLHLMVPSSI